MNIVQDSLKLSSAKPEKDLMSHHNSYHSCITGKEAERRLNAWGGDCYLTRYSEARNCFVLSVHKQQSPKDVIKHFKILRDKDGKHGIEGVDKKFADSTEMLEHYEEAMINPAFTTIGQYFTEESYNKLIRKKCCCCTIA